MDRDGFWPTSTPTRRRKSRGSEASHLLTDVEAGRTGDGQLIRSLTASDATQLIERGVIHSGMIPKVRCALEALSGGIKKVHMLDGRVRHAVLLEIFTDQGIGTEIVAR